MAEDVQCLSSIGLKNHLLQFFIHLLIFFNILIISFIYLLLVIKLLNNFYNLLIMLMMLIMLIMFFTLPQQFRKCLLIRIWNGDLSNEVLKTGRTTELNHCQSSVISRHQSPSPLIVAVVTFNIFPSKLLNIAITVC